MKVTLLSTILLLFITAGTCYGYGSMGDDVNNQCAPTVVYSGDCSTCHSGSKGDPTPAKTAYKSGGDTLTDFFCPTLPPPPPDRDEDGYDETTDCNDTNAAINPGAVEDCNDGIDNNCNGLVDDADPTAVGCVVDPGLLDTDNDGFTPNQGDCDDTNNSVFPGAVEDCVDGLDNDCDGYIDGQDADAVGCPVVCVDDDKDFYSTNGGECGPVDCNDSDSTVNPAALEICDDGKDNNCNTKIDCEDSTCNGDPACLAATCEEYTDRGSCKGDSRCGWSGKGKSCYSLPEAQVECQENGGRWNRKKETCR